MKQALIFLLLCVPTSIFAQCTECNSFEAALKKPEMVKSIIINSHVNKIVVDSVPSFIGQFVNLEILYLTDQPITHIPPSIGQLTKLKELSFASCQLTQLPDAVFTLKNLRELILFTNPFSEGYKAQLKKKVKALMPKTQLLID